MAKLFEILTARSPDAPMVAQAWAQAVPGRGLLGDRYFDGTGTFSPHPPQPDFEVTLVQSEHLEAFATSSGLAFTAQSARRNLVTAGIDLNALVGREFSIGAVRFRGVRLCEPCNYLAKQTSAEVLRGLLHKGGLRAQILSKGTIRVGDAITE